MTRPNWSALDRTARLLTMLGEQLIKNDRIALVELIKNSYDADATRVTVNFSGLSAADEITPRITITDNGEGMPERVIREHWLNPATPAKLDHKRDRGRSPGGRVMQGEKGIGRFAMFKLGNHATIVTRTAESADEFVIDFDLSFLDSEAPPAADSADPVFIDQIRVSLTRRDPVVFTPDAAMGHGTQVEISGVRSRWTNDSIIAAYADIARLQPLVPRSVADPMAQSEETIAEPDFDIRFCQDGIDLGLRSKEEGELRDLFESRAVLRVTGHFDPMEKSFVLNVNGHLSVVSLTDPEIVGLWVFRRYFGDQQQLRSVEELSCGPFDFSLYVFDIRPSAPAEFRLDSDERQKVKDHRIYLYRDGVRVLPYGDIEDDWLQLDMIRGSQGAGRVLSNDQTVGFVYISQAANPLLQDKTNREGLLENGYALRDFVIVLQLAVSLVRRSHYALYLAAEEQKREATARREQQVIGAFKRILADDRLPKELARDLRKLERDYKNEKEYLQVRVERTEDLAGVGLSVEAASHDIISVANNALRLARANAKYVSDWLQDHDVLLHDSRSLAESLSFVTSRLQDVQGLFVSTRTAKRSLEPAEFVTRVARIYGSILKERSIRLDLNRGRPPLKVRTTDAALLQVLVNLFDNAVYWLMTARTLDPVIRVEVDAKAKQVIFADNGPGVRTEDEPFIFEAFFSGKGETGKGLGLYIARHVGARNGFDVDLVTADEHKIASGANFILKFRET